MKSLWPGPKRQSWPSSVERLFLKAEVDCAAIVAMIRRQFNPKRIYQWGSLLHKEMFADYSDIDIALEGRGSIEDVMDPETELDQLFGRAVDIVEPQALTNPIRRKSILKLRRTIVCSLRSRRTRIAQENA